MKKLVLVILFLLSQIVYSNSNSIKIDLAKDKPKQGIIVIKTHLEKIDFIEIVNKLDAKYTIDIKKVTEIPPIDLGAKVSAQGEALKNDRDKGGECNTLANLIQQIDALHANANKEENKKKWMEKELYGLLKKLRYTLQIIERDDDITCESTALAKKMLVNSVYNHPVYEELSENDQLVIVIKRAKLKWKYLVNRYTSARGKWYTSYGFSFISPVIKKSDNFFVQKSSDNGYIIAQKKNSNSDDDGSGEKWLDTDFVPSLFFWWMPTKRMSRDVNFGLTGGLGIDFKNPTVFFGASLVYNYNIGINLGVAFHKQYRLKDKYYEGMTVNEVLEFDDLHKSVYTPNLFLSITFRFGSNPFSPAKANTPQKNEKPETDKKDGEK